MVWPVGGGLGRGGCPARVPTANGMARVCHIEVWPAMFLAVSGSVEGPRNGSAR
jgi:hypothetical protein